MKQVTPTAIITGNLYIFYPIFEDHFFFQGFFFKSMVSIQERVMMPRVRYYTYKTSQPWAKYHTPNAKGSSGSICRCPISIIEYEILHQPKICTVTHCHTLEKSKISWQKAKYLFIWGEEDFYIAFCRTKKHRLVRLRGRMYVISLVLLLTYQNLQKFFHKSSLKHKFWHLLTPKAKLF